MSPREIPAEHRDSRPFGLTERAHRGNVMDGDADPERAITCRCPCETVGEHNLTVEARRAQDERDTRERLERAYRRSVW